VAAALPHVATDVDGRFAFDALRDGTYALRVQRTGSPLVTAVELRVPRTSPVEVVLAGRRVTGTVRDAATGQGVPGAVVQGFAGGPERPVEATTDAQGRYVLDTLVETTVLAPFFARRAGWVDVPDPAKSKDPQTAPAWWFPSRGDLVVDLTLRRAARLTGRVTCDGAPVRDAVVVAQRRGASASRARTGSDGRYAFDGLDSGRVWVQVFCEGSTTAGSTPDDFLRFFRGESPPGTVEIPREGEVVHDVAMEGGVEVSGRVVGAGGAPAAGAGVWATSIPSASAPDGAFRVVAPAFQGRVTVFADHPDLGTGSFGAEAPASKRIADAEIRLEPLPRLRGRVAADAGPPQGAWVQWVAVSATPLADVDWSAADRRPAGADGAFDVAVQPWGNAELNVRVGAPGHAAATLRAKKRPDGAFAADVRLVRAVRLAGRAVVAGTGAPCAGAVVLVDPKWKSEPSMRRAAPLQGVVAAVAGADGRFVVEGLAPGDAFVRVQAPGFVACETRVALPASGETAFELETGGTISGVVATSDGAPCAAARISTCVEVPDAAWVGGKRQVWHGSAVTDERGRFTVECLPAGSYVVTVSPGYGEAPFENVRRDGVPTGSKDVAFTVVATREDAGVALRGKVVGADGSPVAGARVHAGPTSGRGGGSATSGDDGSFAIRGLEPVEHVVRARPPEGTTFRDVGVSTGARWLPGEAGPFVAPRDDVVVRLPEGATISGVVVDAGGAPMPGLWVALGVPPRDRNAISGGIPGDDTDADGRFEITGLPPGRSFRLVEAGWPGRREPAPLVGGEDVAAGTRGLRLTPGAFASIRGTVVDERGAPVPGATVRAIDGKGREPTVVADAAGAFEIASLDARGPLDIVAWAEGLAPKVERGVAAGRADLRLSLAQGLRASGRILDAAGKPVATSRVVLRTDAHPVEIACATDADGRFEAKGLAPGTHRVHFQGFRGDRFAEVPCGTLEAGAEAAELREE
jgi:hypothetical protein